jgi:NAD(P)-dependent dehydrogenase (short-subunit alcohol dehydrogenase family)
LVLTDVSPLDEVVNELGNSIVLARSLDISDVDAVRKLADDVHTAHGSADVVMNIAGIATWGSVEHLTHEQWRRTVEIDLMGPIHVIEAFVPEMIRAGRGGQLVNVSSAAGLLGLPWHAPYSATKFGLRGISEVLRFDLRRHRIGVTLVCPGGVATPIVESVDVAGIDTDAMRASHVTQRFLRHAKSADYAAERILEGVTKNRYLVHTSTDVRLMYATQRFAPHIYAGVMRLMNNVFVRQMEKLGGSGQAPRAAR